MSLSSELKNSLAKVAQDQARFRALVSRLFAYGAICRTESAVEEGFYDDACRIEDLLADYAELAGFRLYHDRDGQVFRLYPPGATVPGMPADDLEPEPMLRYRLSPDLIACALTLLMLHRQATLAGEVYDHGEVRVRVEDIWMLLKTQFRRQIADGATGHAKLLHELRTLRILRASNADIDSPNGYVYIRRSIMNFVDAAGLDAAIAEVAGEGAQTPDLVDTPTSA